MDLRRLGLFVAVADHGTITAAARAEHLAQPAASLALRELEAEVGAALFVRTRTRAVLTPAGEALLGPARQVLRDVVTAAAAVAAVTGLLAGRLDVVSLPSLEADPLAAFVGRFRSQHPSVAVHISSSASTSELVEQILSGDAEVGITDHRRGKRRGDPRDQADERLERVRVATQDLVAVSPPGSAGAGRPLAIRDLARLGLVVTPAGTSLRTVLDQALDEHGLHADVAVESAQREALVPLVLAGAGTSIVPASTAERNASHGIVVRPLMPRLRRDIVLVRRRGTASPAAIRFIELATRVARSTIET